MRLTTLLIRTATAAVVTRPVMANPIRTFFSGLGMEFDRKCTVNQHTRLSPDYHAHAVQAPAARFILFHNNKALVGSREGKEEDGSGSSSSSFLVQVNLDAMKACGLGGAADTRAHIVIGQFSPDAPLIVVDASPLLPLDRSATTAHAAELLHTLQLGGHTPSNASYTWVEGREWLTSSKKKPNWSAVAAGLDDDTSVVSTRDSTVFSIARSLLTWHTKSRHCGSCGSPLFAVEGGVKKECRNPPCGESLYPRTDPVVISLVQSADGRHCLLSRQKQFPPGVYSCCAGFLEAGETIEVSLNSILFFVQLPHSGRYLFCTNLYSRTAVAIV